MANKDNVDIQWVTVNLVGGVVSVGDLLTLLESLDQLGIQTVRFGARQQMFFQVDQEELTELEYVFLNLDLPIFVGSNYAPNVLSSYVGDGIFNKPVWLREGVYKDILDGFDFTPKVKINIVDSTQSFAPYFTGNLNFISSDISNYWYLYIRFPKTNNFYCWKSLIYSGDIAPLSAFLDNKLMDYSPVIGADLESEATETERFLFQAPDTPFEGTTFKLPYYEGFNSYHDKLWLGVYRRNEEFTVAFLKDMCVVCQQSRIAQLYTTPWKSLIIKDILMEDRNKWDNLLDKHRINLRHALNELNWQLGDLCDESLEMKQTLVQYFNQLDVRTYKLCFGIKVRSETGVWGSVIISKSNRDGDRPFYRVEHTTDFDPNSKELKLFKDIVSTKALGAVLLEICECFYVNKREELEEKSEPQQTGIDAVFDKFVYQCSRCMTVYDPDWGDPVQGIDIGVLFNDLPSTYCCSFCGATKSRLLITKLGNYAVN